MRRRGSEEQASKVGRRALNYECRQPITLASAETLANLLRYLLFRKGPLTSNVAEVGGFVRLDGRAEPPDLQFHCGPSFYVRHGFGNPDGHGLTIAPTLVEPRSRGTLRLRSSDPTDPPLIDPRYLDDRADLEILRAGVGLGRRIAAAAALEAYRGREVTPGAAATGEAELDAWIRASVESLYHPVGTCKTGNDPLAVVDADLKVHGVDNLRVADASIMPTITNANTNAPTIMIGEQAARRLLAG